MIETDTINAKLYSSIESLENQLNIWKFREQKIVFTNGCFDILHLGHIDYLTKAAGLGDVLIVGLNSDSSVKLLKGNNRPINNETSRAAVLSALRVIEAVVLFEEETPYNLIGHIKPDKLIKGGDYKVEEIAGHDIVQKNGGEVVIIDLLEGFSTSGIEQKILDLNGK